MLHIPIKFYVKLSLLFALPSIIIRNCYDHKQAMFWLWSLFRMIITFIIRAQSLLRLSFYHQLAFNYYTNFENLFFKWWRKCFHQVTKERTTDLPRIYSNFTNCSKILAGEARSISFVLFLLCMTVRIIFSFFVS